MRPVQYALAGFVVAAASAVSLPALAEMVHFEAELMGEAEAAEIPAEATGHAVVVLDTETDMLEWSVTYSGLSGPVFAAHIHGPAGPGEDAGIQVGLEAPGTSSAPGSGEMTGSAEVTDEQITELMDGRYYVNLHTEAHRGGEVRGFLEVADDAM